MEKQISITWVKSTIGYPKGQHKTIKSLGFNRLNQTITHKDTPSIRGMIFKVNHLLKVNES
jgi:large subunit ribosomal protein L30